jgi:hypothetical protein
MVISQSGNSDPNNDVYSRTYGSAAAGSGGHGSFTPKPDSLSFEPEQSSGQAGLGFSLIDHTSPTVKIDRIVWFCSQAPTTNHLDYDRIYYNYAGMPALLDRGSYAVIGPRVTTTLGLTSDKSDLVNYPLGKPSSQKISIPTPASPNSAPVTDINGTPDANIPNVKVPLGLIVGNTPNTPSGWTTPVGISISEPLLISTQTKPTCYYLPPTVAGTGLYEVRDVFNNIVKEWYGDPKMTDPAVGYFLDTPIERPNPPPPLSPDPNAPYRPLQNTSENLPYTGTEINYKTVFLQRLANPSAPYDPATNPYLTVDWMPIDLTIFDGDDDDTATTVVPFDPDRAIGNPSTATNFATRQRGDTTAAAGNNNYFNIWAPVSNDPQNNTPAGTLAYFNYNLKDHHSLGYLNKAFQPFITGSAVGYNGDPSTQPFPWLPWFGRPYVNQLELMLVPASNPGRLLSEFKPCTAGTDNYTPGSAGSAPFPQLLNFLQAGNANGMNQFGRILDYVGVPSWFEGTEIQANPNLISPNGIPSSPGSHTFFPPYNSISTYREPGRINLNTIYSQDVFNGLMNGNTTPTWANFVSSRGDNYAVMNPAYPSDFNNPFRSGGSVYWNPSYSYLTPSPEINATYMRPTTTGSPNPLFQYTSAQPVDNTDRNPFFHYEDLMRLGNLVTTRSNVYSVWITVGYFEVKPKRINPFAVPAETVPGIPDLAHPDGYELGQEMGSDTGEIVRHRAFYMIDRTIPVGFQRGQDLNVEKAIILKKYIE